MPDRSSRFGSGRHAGVLVPLFSIPTADSWGIGEIADLPAFASWVRRSGLSAVQLLPINEMAEGQSSPYSALSAMAIDPQFITIDTLGRVNITKVPTVGKDFDPTVHEAIQQVETTEHPAGTIVAEVIATQRRRRLSSNTARVDPSGRPSACCSRPSSARSAMNSAQLARGSTDRITSPVRVSRRT